MPLKAKASPVRNASRERPDIVIFDQALTFTEDKAPLKSFVIVEFKHPQLEKFEEDPAVQVNRLIQSIREGHYKDKDGVEIKLQTRPFLLMPTSSAILRKR